MAMAEVSSYAPGTPCWVDLTTSDPEGARNFYGPLFGWELEIGPPETGHYTQAKLRGKPVAGLGGEPKPEEAPVAWITYFATDDVDGAAKRITENGGTLLMPPMDVMGEGHMAIAADPTGAAFGLWQAGRHMGSVLVNEPGTACWNELVTPDLEAARHFYSAVLDYQWEDLDTGAGGPPYATFALGDGRPVGGAMQMTDQVPAGTPPNWLVYFAVADTDATVAKNGELGGGVSMAPMDSPYGRFAVLNDPQGGVFAVIRMPERT